MIDINENMQPPLFPDVALEGSMEENMPPKTEVIRIEAKDPEGSAVTYRLVSGSGLGHFEIDAMSGAISTKHELDYEEVPFYWLTVRAEDAPTALYPSLYSVMHVMIRVLNKNDRSPVFSQPAYFADVDENSPENQVSHYIEAQPIEAQLLQLLHLGDPESGGP